MKRLLVLIALFSGISPAFAQVPVSDTQTGAKVKKTTRCVVKTRVDKQATLDPTQGIRGAVAAGSGGAPQNIANVGTSILSGIGATPAGGGALAGIDFSNLLGIGGNGQLSIELLGQVLSATRLVGAALTANQSGLQTASKQIGSADGIQHAWDQNSGIRVNAANVWGQTVQAGTTHLQLRNDALLRSVMLSSANARTMAYDRDSAQFVAKRTKDSETATVRVQKQDTHEQIAADLQATQDQTASSVRADDLWAGANVSEYGVVTNATK